VVQKESFGTALLATVGITVITAAFFLWAEFKK
jgi:hypothetical protein